MRRKVTTKVRHRKVNGNKSEYSIFMQGFQRTGIPLTKDGKMPCSLKSREGEKKQQKTKE